ncbi:hypothetical protein ACVH9Z_35760 [Rhodococcus opacus]|nr:hypothetical protein [Rhodococcus opacus]ANS28555.1 hypothetical protein R1CP_19365 [Rhodococcus opacus]MCZ4586983.1 hypothetical protein [Rhodococcus opacus]MDV6244698.1 hypothetical protein [Rhodococcus opacus]WKN52980.1 hypothetical protein HJ581_0003545 [Rhodococcus opacus]
MVVALLVTVDEHVTVAEPICRVRDQGESGESGDRAGTDDTARD